MLWRKSAVRPSRLTAFVCRYDLCVQEICRTPIKATGLRMQGRFVCTFSRCCRDNLSRDLSDPVTFGHGRAASENASTKLGVLCQLR